MDEPLRVLIADDHPTFLAGLAQVVTGAGMHLAGSAETAAGTVALAASLEPDVVVLDLRLPDYSGIEAAQQIIAARPQTRVLILSYFDREDYVLSAIRAGVRGYLTKTALLAEIVQAISAVGSGQLVFGTGIASKVLRHFHQPLQQPAEPPFPQLTAREREVLVLVAKGRRNQEIARALQISTKTVQNHLSNILTQLGVADRSEAVLRAREARLHER
ncbi:MAG: response regulator transcription factor [Catenulispora sp.]|nr:response regulator transcription factor [Catenulispora sp.]